jgi:hypothetical protein
MINTKADGFHGEGRTLCLSCSEKIYGNSLEGYLCAGKLKKLGDPDRPADPSQGLLCDDCLCWIFRPEQGEETWWLVEPDPKEHLRLLAPFADFLETIQVDAANLREVL